MLDQLLFIEAYDSELLQESLFAYFIPFFSRFQEPQRNPLHRPRSFVPNGQKMTLPIVAMIMLGFKV